MEKPQESRENELMEGKKKGGGGVLVRKENLSHSHQKDHILPSPATICYGKRSATADNQQAIHVSKLVVCFLFAYLPIKILCRSAIRHTKNLLLLSTLHTFFFLKLPRWRLRWL